MADDSPSGERITVSLSTLRAELSGLELRLVDRLNGALEHKADRAVQEQLVHNLADVQARLSTLENTSVKREGPVVQKVDAHEKEIQGLRAVSGYKKWLWAQTIALGGVVVALVAVSVQLS